MENKKAPHHHSTEREEKQPKNTYFRYEKQRFFLFLQKNTATCSMASKETGIPHKNLCRYKEMLESEGLIMQLFKTKCRVTGHSATYLTGNPVLIENLKKRNDAGYSQQNTAEKAGGEK
jgi:hypothetical protein